MYLSKPKEGFCIPVLYINKDESLKIYKEYFKKISPSFKT